MQLFAVHFAWQRCVAVAQIWSMPQSVFARHCTQVLLVVSHTPRPTPQSGVVKHCTHVFVVVSQTPPAAAAMQSPDLRHWTQRPDVVSQTPRPAQLCAVHV
jgi:hypothetical protein